MLSLSWCISRERVDFLPGTAVSGLTQARVHAHGTCTHFLWHETFGGFKWRNPNNCCFPVHVRPCSLTSSSVSLFSSEASPFPNGASERHSPSTLKSTRGEGLSVQDRHSPPYRCIYGRGRLLLARSLDSPGRVTHRNRSRFQAGSRFVIVIRACPLRKFSPYTWPW